MKEDESDYRKVKASDRLPDDNFQRCVIGDNGSFYVARYEANEWWVYGNEENVTIESWLEPIETEQMDAEEMAKKIYLSITSFSPRNELGGIERDWIERCIVDGLNQFTNTEQDK